ncbi:MAG TPA: MbnP family protein [Nevskiaceae bacterium]|nr:MbnP family protein [Nevskiaceae bacterium]
MRRFVIASLVGVVVAGGVGAWLWQKALDKRERRLSTPTTVTLRFHPLVAGDSLVFNQPRYRNPGPSGSSFAIRDFQFFVSNVRLRSAAGDHVPADSYHLVRFDGGETVFEIALTNVPPRAYTAVELGIGVDAAANGSIAQRGDLDPNGRMAWTWEVGYKFVLLEGTLEALLDGTPAVPLVYHAGFSENYRTLSASVAHVRFDDGPVLLDYEVDAMKLFRGESTIDLRTLPTVKFDRADAARLASNYARMIRPVWTDAVTTGGTPP